VFSPGAVSGVVDLALKFWPIGIGHATLIPILIAYRFTLEAGE
jgi:hypothetical protein